MYKTSVAVIGSLFFSLFLAASVHAANADGSARIRLSGQTQSGKTERVTVREIEAIGISTVKAYNPYEKRTDEYTGVWFADFVKHFAKPGTHAVVTRAIDDYEIEFKPGDWQQFRILIATRVNGRYIGFKQKGPMRIIYPDYDENSEKYKRSLPKWMWMITKAEFK